MLNNNLDYVPDFGNDEDLVHELQDISFDETLEIDRMESEGCPNAFDD